MSVLLQGGKAFGPFTSGREIYVKPASGSDGHDGKTPGRAVKTLSKALSLATANNNDIVYLIGEGATGALSTDYLSAALDWNKDGVSLIGYNSGNGISPRSRISWVSGMTASADTVMFTVSANNCYFANLEICNFAADANLAFNCSVTGDRNRFYRCHFAGIGNDTQDAAGAYSLLLSGAEENLFEECLIGLDTVARGTAANSEILFGSGATRNHFLKCKIITYAEAAGHQFVIAPASSLDRWTLFEDCTFLNQPTGVSSGTTMTEALDVTSGGSPNGAIFCKDCSFFGVGDVEAAASGYVYVHGSAVTAADNSLGGVTAPS
jgi:hypothetical protein